MHVRASNKEKMDYLTLCLCWLSGKKEQDRKNIAQRERGFIHQFVHRRHVLNYNEQKPSN
jgi:hypothetical protein